MSKPTDKSPVPFKLARLKKIAAPLLVIWAVISALLASFKHDPTRWFEGVQAVESVVNLGWAAIRGLFETGSSPSLPPAVEGAARQFEWAMNENSSFEVRAFHSGSDEQRCMNVGQRIAFLTAAGKAIREVRKLVPGNIEFHEKDLRWTEKMAVCLLNASRYDDAWRLLAGKEQEVDDVLATEAVSQNPAVRRRFEAIAIRIRLEKYDVAGHLHTPGVDWQNVRKELLEEIDKRLATSYRADILPSSELANCLGERTRRDFLVARDSGNWGDAILVLNQMQQICSEFQLNDFVCARTLCERADCLIRGGMRAEAEKARREAKDALGKLGMSLTESQRLEFQAMLDGSGPQFASRPNSCVPDGVGMFSSLAVTRPPPADGRFLDISGRLLAKEFPRIFLPSAVRHLRVLAGPGPEGDGRWAALPPCRGRT